MKLRKTMIFAVLLVASTMLFAQSFNNSDKWSVFDDKGDKGTSTINKASEMVTIEGKEVLSITLTGTVTTSFQYGYAGVTADADPATITALKEATGISFYANGDGRQYRVRVETSDIRDYDYYGFVFTAPKGKPVKITVPYSKLTQDGWGAKKSFSAASASKVSFQTIGQPIPGFEFTIADLKAVK